MLDNAEDWWVFWCFPRDPTASGRNKFRQVWQPPSIYRSTVMGVGWGGGVYRDTLALSTHTQMQEHTFKHIWAQLKKIKGFPGRPRRVSFQEGVILWCWLPSNVCKLSCPIMGDKWHVELRLRLDSFALDMTTLPLNHVCLCWWIYEMSDPE